MADPDKGLHPGPSARIRWVRPAAVLAGVVLVLGACGGSSKKADTTTSVTSATGATTTAAAARPTQAPTAQDSAALQQAIAALGANYHFASTVDVDGSTLITAEGDRVGAGVRLTLTSSAGVVSYVITADGSWAKPENGAWVKLDVPPANTDPIAALASPQTVAKIPGSTGGQEYAVVVDNAALGITGGGTATLTVKITGGQLTQVAYNTTVSGKAAQVTTVLSAAKDTDPVVAPV